MMSATEKELKARIAELEAAQVRAETFNRISRGLNTAEDEEAILRVLAASAIEGGALSATLTYIDVEPDGTPGWAETVAAWHRDRPASAMVGFRMYLPDYPSGALWISNPNHPLLIPDVTTDSRLDENIQAHHEQMGVRAVALLPLNQRGRWVGLVTFNWGEPHEFTDHEMMVYQAIIDLASPAVDNRRLLVGKQKAVTETLYEISRGLNIAQDEDELLYALARPAIETGAFNVALMYVDLDTAGDPEWFEAVSVWQREGEPLLPEGTRTYAPDYPFTRLFLDHPDEPQFISDVETDERVDDNLRGLLNQMSGQATLFLPLTQAGRWVGLLAIVWDEPHEFSEQERELYRALIGLGAPAVENRRLVTNLGQIVEERTKEATLFKALVENSIDSIAVQDLATGELIYANKACHEIFGYDYANREMIGMDTMQMWPADDLPQFMEEIAPQIMSGGWRGDVRQQRKDGSIFDAHAAAFVMQNEAGEPVSMAAIIRDITEQKRAEAEREQLQQEIIEAQQQALKELSTPVIPIMDAPGGGGGVIVMPLIGSIDTIRARDITRRLLAGIRQHRAKVVILDITGVPMVDSGVANHLNKTVQAARLKGARTIVTGISDAVAETIVDLGIDWSGIETLADLQTGLIIALKSLNVKLIRE